MSDKKILTVDDARALLSDHVEGALPEDTQAELDALMASDPALRRERDDLARTVELLRALPRPELSSQAATAEGMAEGGMVANVRRRLADERRAASASPPTVTEIPIRRWGGFEVAIGLAAAASIAVFVAVVGMPGQDGSKGDTLTAGVGGPSEVVAATLVVPGAPRALLLEIASKTGVDAVGDAGPEHVFEGDQKAIARFVLMLKADAAVRGAEVSGVVPDAARVRLLIKNE